MELRRTTQFAISSWLFLWAGAFASAQVQLPWRFWDVADGLPESSTSWIETDAAGNAWTRHSLPTITRLDGYSVRPIADKNGGRRLETAPDGSVWTLRRGILRHYNGSKWTSFQLLAADGALVQGEPFVALKNDKVLILRADRILEFDAKSGTSHIVRAAATRLSGFTSIRRGRAGAFWVGGNRGLGQISESLGWRDFVAPPGVSKLSQPHEGDGGEVFAGGVAGGQHVLVRFAGNRSSVIYRGTHDEVQGWRGGDGEIWVADGNQVARLSRNGKELVARTDALAGIVQNTWQSSGGAFWIATSQGLARYAPPLWRTDSAVREADLDGLVNSICEDRDGRIWFLSSRYLVRFDGQSWQKIPLPRGFVPEPGVTEALAALPDGNVAIATSKTWMLIFHPETGLFETLAHPLGRTIRMFGRRRNGELMVETLDGEDRSGFQVETFDGHNFHAWLDLNKDPGFWDVRSICETSTGEVWFGAVDALGVYRGGQFRRLGPRDGFKMDGAFSIQEMASGRLMVGGRHEIEEFDGKQWKTLAAGMMVRAIARAKDGTVWAASGNGIQRMARGAWITNDIEDGLPSAVGYKVFVDGKGRVWAGTLRGISEFHPEADADAPRTIIGEELNSHTVAPGERVRIVFSGIDRWKFTDARRLLFSWRMDGGAWSDYAPANAAFFPPMRAATHRFEVRAMDRNGNVDPQGAAFAFAVLAPWYAQIGFIFLLAAGLSVILLLLCSAWLHHRSVAFESNHDQLTRLLNRRAFTAELDSALAEARVRGSAVALLLLDLDRFKPINDTLGHAAGDEFLQQISRRMTQCLGAGDILARVGGDEFAIIVRGADTRDAAESLSGRILGELLQPCRIDKHELTSSASIGISLFPEHTSNAQTLQKLADVAMYCCKKRARGTFCVYGPRMNGTDLSSGRVAELIADSLEHGYFSLDYQPIFGRSGDCVAVEALVRMDHPQAGKLAPQEFIAVAEKNGLIIGLGEWVLNEGCRQLALWRAGGHCNLRMFVNVSPVQLEQSGFAETVMGALDRYQPGDGALILEITETALMNDLTQARAQLEVLRTRGVAIALDDFGTGYSSLSSLHVLPIDFVKMDKSFTQLVGKDLRGEAVLGGMVRLARQLGFTIVAEGVETRAQEATLIEAHCDLFQGFLLGPPMPAELCTLQLKAAASVYAPDEDLSLLEAQLGQHLVTQDG